MTEITREQLGLAALAGGHKIYVWCVLCGDQIAYADIGPEESVAWRPHTDIADAARLALMLHMLVDVSPRDVRVLGAIKSISLRHDGTQPDKERAYCEAVTMCAAEIGRQMKGGA